MAFHGSFGHPLGKRQYFVANFDLANRFAFGFGLGGVLGAGGRWLGVHQGVAGEAVECARKLLGCPPQPKADGTVHSALFGRVSPVIAFTSDVTAKGNTLAGLTETTAEQKSLFTALN